MVLHEVSHVVIIIIVGRSKCVKYLIFRCETALFGIKFASNVLLKLYVRVFHARLLTSALVHCDSRVTVFITVFHLVIASKVVYF